MKDIMVSQPGLQQYLRWDEGEVVREVMSTPLELIADKMTSDTRTDALAGQDFRYVETRNPDSDNRKLVLALGEFAYGATIPAYARALAIQRATKPDAALMLLANNSFGGKRLLNFSLKERRALWHGDNRPFVERLKTITEGYDEVTIYGPSQGGVIGAGFAADKDTPAMALHVIESPNVEERTRIGLASDFAGCGADLKTNIGHNGESELPIVRYHLDQIGPVGLLQYGAGIFYAPNIALSGIMRRGNLQQQIEATLAKGGSVSHFWTDGDKVSRDEHNQSIANHLARAGHLRYGFERLVGADHSITNEILVGIAGVRYAMRLAGQNTV